MNTSEATHAEYSAWARQQANFSRCSLERHLSASMMTNADHTERLSTRVGAQRVVMCRTSSTPTFQSALFASEDPVNISTYSRPPRNPTSANSRTPQRIARCSLPPRNENTEGTRADCAAWAAQRTNDASFSLEKHLSATRVTEGTAIAGHNEPWVMALSAPERTCARISNISTDSTITTCSSNESKLSAESSPTVADSSPMQLAGNAKCYGRLDKQRSCPALRSVLIIPANSASSSVISTDSRLSRFFSTGNESKLSTKSSSTVAGSFRGLDKRTPFPRYRVTNLD